ncbi:DUF58 domain-containing protein [Methylococcus sp. EFPC2]|uniref:DUF58 domain-containing protein n=1 Tax=Methylococcus sp. EFPC2 TaxID=2812648 RepID=UPI00196781FF|nr:DUF58 domain-containing protein [Methylococcus sp. EFPC2]QSA98258.1 DUF58 domain-containing protein [Methylococcus sp. EFPC2]
MTAEFYYRVGWRARGSRPGRHPGVQSGAGFDFLGHVPLIDHPDPRHLDIRATLADPAGQLMVRRYRQRAAIPVYLVADLSASMGFSGTQPKMELIAEFARSLAWSAWRSGDYFGLYACDHGIRPDLSLPLRAYKGLDEDLFDRLRRFRPSASDARSLAEVPNDMSREKSLIFLVSDFHLPDTELRGLLEAYAGHDLVPVVLWDSAEYEKLPRWGLAELRDPETGRRRRLFLRPALRENIRLSYTQRREELARLFAPYGREPYFMVDRFDPDKLTHYFHAS